MIKKRLPNLIIAGVNKAGSTSLFKYLSMHPDICGTQKKETYYFSPIIDGKKTEQLSEYKKYFDHCQNQKYIMESTPGYFYGGKNIAKEIKKVLNDVKIIIILRDPIDRLFSHYKAEKSELRISPDKNLFEYIKDCEKIEKEAIITKIRYTYWGISLGYYSKYIKPWFDIFGKDNVKILFFENLIENQRKTLNEICEWLGIYSEIYENYQFTIENKSIKCKNMTIHKLAILLNKKYEIVFRKFPNIKKNLRRLYCSINAKDFDEKIQYDDRIYLKSLYRESNIYLKEILKSNGYNNLPQWLLESDN